MKRNFILMTDSGKAGYADFFPKDVTNVFMYIASRTSETLLFGLQYYLKEYLEGQVFTLEDINEADELLQKHFEGQKHFSRHAWERLYHRYGGRLPVRIHAMPEGVPHPGGIPLVTIENTDEDFPWIVSHVQSLLTRIWYPSSIATRYRSVRKSLEELCKDSSDIGPSYLLHDITYRSQTSEEQAALSGAAFLLFFGSSDNLAGIRLLREYYKANMSGTSMPFIDPSAVITFGDQYTVLHKALKQYNTSDFSISIDALDYQTFVGVHITHDFIDKIKDRSKAGLTTILKVDSMRINDAVLWILNVLGAKLGTEKNSRGMKVLKHDVRLMVSSSYTTSGADEFIRSRFYDYWAPENFIVGIEPEFEPTRSNKGFHSAVSWIKQAGGEFNIGKVQTGKSALIGRVYVGQGYDVRTDPNRIGDQMNLVFQDGHVTHETTFDEIAER